MCEEFPQGVTIAVRRLISRDVIFLITRLWTYVACLLWLWPLITIYPSTYRTLLVVVMDFAADYYIGSCSHSCYFRRY
jgi:hypothetical protein